MRRTNATVASLSCFSGKRKFETFIGNRPAQDRSLLPLTHLTDTYDLRDVLEAGEIEPKPCSIFGDDLLYFFYGRPAYRKNAGTQANSITAYAPIVFIAHARAIIQAEIAFPFDSGAFKNEKYEEFTHHRMRVEDFGFKPSTESISNVISTFFGDNRSYYDQTPATRLKIPPSQFEAETYNSLVHYNGKNSRDDRSSTLEIIFRSAIALKGLLMAAVVPNSILKDEFFSNELNKLEVDILGYVDGANLSPASTIPRLQDVVRNYYVRREFFTDDH